MFWQKKKSIASHKSEFEKIISTYVPKSALSITNLGIEGVIDNIAIDFVFLIIEESDLQRFTSFSSNAIQIAIDHKADVVANIGGLLQFAVGPRTDTVDCTPHRIKIASLIALSLGTSVRIVHGRTQSRVGVVGTEFRKNWGYYPIAIVQILQTLLAAKPGIPIDMGNLA